MDKKVIVEYNAYLGHICTKEENVGKDELELAREYNLRDRAVLISKCGVNIRKKLKLGSNSYFLEPVLRMKSRYLSDVAYGEESVLGIISDEKEAKDIPFTNIYELEQINNHGIYRRSIEDIYLLEELSEEEQISLDEIEIEDYLKVENAQRYTLEVASEDKYTLTSLHTNNTNLKSYFKVDDDYPESLKELVRFYKAVAPGVYEKKELPERKVNKGIFKARIK